MGGREIYVHDLAENDAVRRSMVRDQYPGSKSMQTEAKLKAGETHEIKFLAVILGARTPAPRIDAPVIQIPLFRGVAA